METTTIDATSTKVDKINERIPRTSKPRVVIIGGGFAGIELVSALEKLDVQVVMVDKRNHHTFIPLLYQVATAGLSPGDISSPLREFLQNNKNFHFRMAKVQNILSDEKKIVTNLGELEYDYLVIASGATTNFFGNDQLKKNALKLREMSDAVELRVHLLENFEEALQLYDNEADELEKHMNIVIVGGGPTGVEMAGAIGELKRNVLPKDYPELDFSQMKIHLVENQTKILAAMSEKSAKRAERYVRKFGVDLHLGKMVKGYENGVVSLSDGTSIKTNTLIWAAGVKGSLVPGLREGAVERGRVAVDEFNRAVGHDYIFAIGDVSIQKVEKYPNGLPQLAPVAIQQAKHLGANLGRIIRKENPVPFKYTDKGTMATIGRNKAVVDAPFGIRLGGFIGWFVWMFVHLFSIVGIRRKVLVFSNWIWNYLTYNRGNRLIINKDTDDV